MSFIKIVLSLGLDSSVGLFKLAREKIVQAITRFLSRRRREPRPHEMIDNDQLGQGRYISGQLSRVRFGYWQLLNLFHGNVPFSSVEKTGDRFTELWFQT